MQKDEKNILLRAENLKKYYPVRKKGFHRAPVYIKPVDNVSFVVNKNHTLGLVGESGCGKSTIGKAILNLLEPDGGRVVYQGTEIFDVEKGRKLPAKEMTALRKEMQMIFQDPYACLDPRKSIGYIVSEGLKKHTDLSRAEIADQAAFMLHLCGMDRSAMLRYPHEFSGGQRQRIGIARALAMNPKFLVCDEPTAALDVSIQSQILNLMLDLKEELGLTYLFISHNFSVVKAFCDEIAVMYLGKIVEWGKADEVYACPRHPYTQALIASVPIQHPDQAKKEVRIKGSIPSAVDVPGGCRFHTRCPYKQDRCTEEEPAMRFVDGGWTACHLYDA